MRLVGPRKQRCRCRLSRLLACAVLLAQLLLCGTSPLIAADTDVTPFLSITSTDKANPEEYYMTLLSQDSTILAGSTTVLGSDGIIQPKLSIVKGLRSVGNVREASTVQNAPKRTSTASNAFRADFLSEFLVAMALLYLDSTDELPFGRTAPIPSTYLPTSYTGGATFVNPSFPTVPITLNMLLQHVSSLTESNVDPHADTSPPGTVLTLSAFVDSLFATATRVFSSRQPGLSTSYAYSRHNMAIVAYVVERVLSRSTKYSTLSGIGEFVFTVVMPPLQLGRTFLLNRSGHIISAAPHPFRSSKIHSTVSYAAHQVLDDSSTGIPDSAWISVPYFSNYVVFTTGADIATLVREVLLPGGYYHTRIGSPMRQSTMPIAEPAMGYASARTAGLFLFHMKKLCSTMYAAIAYSGNAPYCRYSSETVAESAPPFGLVSTSGANELAIVCVPVVHTEKTFCSIAELSLSSSGCCRNNAAPVGGRAVGLAMVGLAHLTSESMPSSKPSTPQVSNQTPNGWFVFLGVAATLVVVVVASYITDYLIQPPPPTKIIEPAVTGQIGLRSGTALNGPIGGGGGSSSEVPADGESPETVRENGRGYDADDLYSGSDKEENTPYLTRSGGPPCGSSSLRWRRPRQRRHRGNGEQNPPSDSSYYSSDDGCGDSTDSVDRVSTGSQRPNPKGALRFDAYI